MTRWTNWAGTATAVPRRVHKPRSTPEIAEVVANAAVEGRHLRVWGSGHSFTPIAVAESDAMDLTAWTGIASADVKTGLVTVRSGTTLKTLNAELDKLGLAMTNLGDIDAQTVAGAISTGTHGTGARLGGIATQIAALQLVLAAGPGGTSPAARRPTPCPPARDRDTDRRAATGSRGRLGGELLGRPPAQPVRRGQGRTRRARRDLDRH